MPHVEMAECAIEVLDRGDSVAVKIDNPVSPRSIRTRLEDDEPPSGFVNVTFVENIARRRREIPESPHGTLIRDASGAPKISVLNGGRVHEVVVARMRLDDERRRCRTDAGARACVQIKRRNCLELSLQDVVAAQLRRAHEIDVQRMGWLPLKYQLSPVLLLKGPVAKSGPRFSTASVALL